MEILNRMPPPPTPPNETRETIRKPGNDKKKEQKRRRRDGEDRRHRGRPLGQETGQTARDYKRYNELCRTLALRVRYIYSLQPEATPSTGPSLYVYLCYFYAHSSRPNGGAQPAGRLLYLYKYVPMITRQLYDFILYRYCVLLFVNNDGKLIDTQSKRPPSSFKPNLHGTLESQRLSELHLTYAYDIQARAFEPRVHGQHTGLTSVCAPKPDTTWRARSNLRIDRWIEHFSRYIARIDRVTGTTDERNINNKNFSVPRSCRPGPRPKGGKMAHPPKGPNLSSPSRSALGAWQFVTAGNAVIHPDQPP